MTDKLVFAGDETTPLFSVAEPLILERRVYFPDYLGHRILVYSTSGILLSTIGRRGTAPGEFQMPYGVSADRFGNLYVNDRGNQRVQVFDHDHRVIRAVATPGQNEQLFLVGEGADLLLQGVGRCAGSAGCLFTRYNKEGRAIRTFAEVQSASQAFTWQAGLGARGRLYVVNMLDDVVESYTLSGQRLGEFRLSSPALQLFDKRSQTLSESPTVSLRRRLNTEDYTLVRRLVVLDSLVLVQMERRNRPRGTPEFVLDIYGERGRLLHHSIETPGIVHSSGSNLYFVHQSNSGFGTVTIQRCNFLQ